MDQETGECDERQLNHSDGEAEKFYRELKQRGVSVRVGMEATGHSRWFERLLAELGFEMWIGDAAKIKRQPTALAPASTGADADANHESAASGGHERGLSLEEKTVQRTGASTARETLLGSLGQPATERIVGADGPAGSKNR